MISGLKNGITRATNLCPRRFRGRIFQRNVKLLKLYKSTSFKQPGGALCVLPEIDQLQYMASHHVCSPFGASTSYNTRGTLMLGASHDLL